MESPRITIKRLINDMEQLRSALSNEQEARKYAEKLLMNEPCTIPQHKTLQAALTEKTDDCAQLANLLNEGVAVIRQDELDKLKDYDRLSAALSEKEKECKELK